MIAVNCLSGIVFSKESHLLKNWKKQKVKKLSPGSRLEGFDRPMRPNLLLGVLILRGLDMDYSNSELNLPHMLVIPSTLYCYSKVSPGCKILYGLLNQIIHDEAIILNSQLAEALVVDTKTIQTWIRELKEHGFLEVVYDENNQRKMRLNKYRFGFGLLEEK